MSSLVELGEAPAWGAVLQGLGLRPGGDGYRNRRIRFQVRSGWGTFESNGTQRSDALRGQLGRPGLWKLFLDARGAVRGVFELPPSLLALAESDPARFEDIVGWALATAGGKVDKSWSPPTKAQVEGCLPDKALTLQVGAIARQGALILDDDRLTFRFPVVHEIPRSLSAARKAWLRELLVDAQNRWRLVRIGMNGHAEVQAQVDLTGAPHHTLEELVHIGTDALRLVVSSLVEPADFLVNGAAGCRAVEVRPNRA
jgi:hypothetical protein